MMRLQRVGRKNDPSFRIVVVDKRTGPKSNKNIDILGSYNPKMNHVQLDVEKAKGWLSKGVQPSDTVHNILVAQKVLDGKKVNVLPRKAPIVDEEAIKKAEEEKAAAEAAAAAEAEASTEESTETPEEAPAEAPAEEVSEAETSAADEAAESAKEEASEPAPVAEETPATEEGEKKEAA